MSNNEIMNMSDSFNSDIFVSFQPQTDDDKALVYKALNAPDMKLSDLINTVITIRDFTCESILLHNEDGSERQGVRIGLICTDGTTVMTSSNGIHRALKTLVKLYGAPTWTKGIAVKVTQEERNGRRIFNLVPQFGK